MALGGFWLWSSGVKGKPGRVRSVSLVGVCFGAWGFRANSDESDLAPWWVFGFSAWGLRANPAESDLAPVGFGLWGSWFKSKPC